jgi:hypothetical protein
LLLSHFSLCKCLDLGMIRTADKERKLP